MNNRIKCIDYLKTLAIIAVVFYHIGLFNNGYLGVEVFFVISGYLFIKGIQEPIAEKRFKPIKYILKKTAEFWPLIVFGGLISLVIGYFNMLPDDYENLAQSVIASNVFANNILQAITTKNYWDVVNIYKALMHTWYIGVLLQALVFLSIVLWVISKLFKKNNTKKVLIVLTVISFALYIFPFFSASDKFYYFPFRLFEITLGCLIIYLPKLNLQEKTIQLIGNIFLVIIIFVSFTNIYVYSQLSMLIVVISTVVAIYAHSSINEDYGINDKIYKIITIPGKYSYDIYIWHQISIAFLYYFVFKELNVFLILLVVILTCIFSYTSVHIREKCALFRSINKRLILSLCIAITTCVVSLFIYMHAGVVRDVPECPTAHCGRREQHFSVGAFASPTVRFGRQLQTLNGVTAHCRSLI